MFAFCNICCQAAVDKINSLANVNTTSPNQVLSQERRANQNNLHFIPWNGNRKSNISL